MTVVRELIAFLGFDVDKKAVDDADASFSKLKASVAGVAVTVAGAALAVYGLVKAAADAGGEATDGAAKFGITAESYQELKFAAQQSGASMDEVGSALRKLQQRSFEATHGNKTFAESFRRAGIKLTDASGHLRPSVDLFADIAEVMSKASSESERTALGMRLMGGAGQSLLPLLREGRDGVEALRARARELGLVMSTEDAAAAETFGDKADELGHGLAALARDMGFLLLPAVGWVVSRLTDALIANRGLALRGFAVVARWAVIVARAFVALVGQAEDLAHWIDENSGFVAAFASVALTALIVKTLAAAAAWSTYAIAQAAALAPLILASAAVVAFGVILALFLEDLYAFSSGAPSLIGDFIDAFTKHPINASDSWLVVLLFDIVDAFRFWDKAFKKFLDTLQDKGWADAFEGLFAPIGDMLDLLRENLSEFLEGFIPDWLRSFVGKIEVLKQKFGFGGGHATVVGNAAPVRSGAGGPVPAPFPAGPPAQGGRSAKPRTEINIQHGAQTFTINVPPGSSPDELKRQVSAAVDDALSRDRELTARQLAANDGVVY